MNKSVLQCSACGYQSSQWYGRCPGCGSWDSLVSVHVSSPRIKKQNPTVPLQSLEEAGTEETRLSVGIAEFDRVLGGGIVPGSLVLIGGDPGIGKSTLVLQAACTLSKNGPVLYATGEESARQISLRARRLRISNAGIMIAAETDVDAIINHIVSLRPCAVIIDSIQTTARTEVQAVPGSVAQVRECAAVFQQVAKGMEIPVFLIGHVTKEGILAGPRLLEHAVDVVLYLEGDRHHSYRILRSVKNRFGATNEIGVFEMREEGLVEVPNPSAFFMGDKREETAVGSVVVPTIQGTRPLLVEVQALVCPNPYGMPRRMTAGFDTNRAALLIAVLDKKVGFRLGGFDTYINAVGGVKLMEPGADLAVAVAVASSYREVPVKPGMVVVGEVGLTGEVRPVSALNARLKEAAKLGFDRAVVCAGQQVKEHLKTIEVTTLAEAITAALAT
ncbi:MAG: DNA repair protein RadA [Bacillota bacterium]